MSIIPRPSTSRRVVNERLILLACSALALTIACTHANGKNYFPLSDKAKWEYTGHASSANSNQINFHATVRVDGETLINNKRYFKCVITSDLSNSPEMSKGLEAVRYYRVADDGIYVRLGNDPERPELLEIPLPIPIGTRWLSGATEVQAERASTINIGGREYKDCLKLTFRQSDGVHITEYYLAPDVGAVKVVYVNHTDPQSTIELTLDNYQP
jgi:hypothetical protein